MGRFKKGQSGNPGGRPKLAAELRERFLRDVDECVRDYWLDEVQEREREIITPAGPMTMVCRGKDAAFCSKMIAAYGLGKPVQSVEVKGELEVRDAREMTTAQLDARIAELEGANVEH